MIKTFTILTLFFCLITVFGQTDSTKKGMLLMDLRVQLECTEAIDSLYNGNFLVAEKQFGWLQEQYPDHPLGYFLMALSQRWKILPNDEETKYDDKFFEYLEITIEKGKALYKDDKVNPEASFFLASAYGLKAQRLAENDRLLSAVGPSEKASDYIVKNLEVDETYGPEFLFGKGLYNYFREWIPMHKKGLKPIIMTFRKGDMELGIEQLQKTANTAFYTRIEAMVYLMDIYCVYGIYKGTKREFDWSEAFNLSKNLYKSYSSNKYFERRYAELAVKTGKEYTLGMDIMIRNLALEANKPGTLDKRTHRNFCYFYAENLWGIGEKSKAISYYETVAKLSQELDIAELDYSMEAYYKVASFSKDLDKVKSIDYYELYVDNFDKKSVKYSKKEGQSEDYKTKRDVGRKKEKVSRLDEAKDYIKANKVKKFLGIF